MLAVWLAVIVMWNRSANHIDAVYRQNESQVWMIYSSSEELTVGHRQCIGFMYSESRWHYENFADYGIGLGTPRWKIPGLAYSDYKVTTAVALGTASMQDDYLSISYGLLFACTSLPVAVWIVALVKAWRRQQIRAQMSEKRCRKCGYDLRASPERCPECGTLVWTESRPGEPRP
jgi:hypothetical protein